MRWIDGYRSRHDEAPTAPVTNKKKQKREPAKTDKVPGKDRTESKPVHPLRMPVLVIGAGAVGSYLASKLILAGHEVVVVDRPERADLIRSLGFHLRATA